MNEAKQTPEENKDPAEHAADTPASETGEEAPSIAEKGETDFGAEVDPRLEEQQAEITGLKDKLLRAMAEVENMRRRAEKEKEDAHNYAITKFARDVLAVSDNLQRAIQSIPAEARANEDVKAVVTGVEMTEAELLSTLEKHKITKISPEGKKFDPNLHQAMFEIENPSVEPGTVMQVVQHGYLIADRLLRPAMVGVAKGGQKKSDVSVDEQA
ncbi:MAG: nucleotide exchange factor GrpE [Proteobacteria bacterium]|nr:nucleotide exchange factor GrpE [Pseudomonadota bacterium]